MKTIFVNGLMIDRCEVFLRMLAQNHLVIGDGYGALAEQTGLNFMDSLAVEQRITAADLKQQGQVLFQHTEDLATNLAVDLNQAGLSPKAGWQIPADMVKSDLIPRVDRVLRRERVFRTVHAQHPVDLVISGSDYGSHSRIIALAARQMGIPTLNLEHGFFFSRFDQRRVDEKNAMPTLFVSQYANLDNELELEGFAREAEDYPHLNTQFLALGTPVSTVADQPMDKAAALTALGLAEDKKRVLVLGSWIEARAINSVVQGQLDTIAVYEDLFASLAEIPEQDRPQLMIKVHPADSHAAVFPGEEAALKDMAHQAGLAEPLVFKDQLPALLSVCDAVVSMGFSSVLFDAFQLDKPAVVRVLPFLAPSSKPGWMQEINIPLREGVMAAVMDGPSLWQQVLADMGEARSAELKEARAQMRERYGLQHRSVEEKSAAIIQWVDDLLVKN